MPLPDAKDVRTMSPSAYISRLREVYDSCIDLAPSERLEAAETTLAGMKAYFAHQRFNSNTDIAHLTKLLVSQSNSTTADVFDFLDDKIELFESIGDRDDQGEWVVNTENMSSNLLGLFGRSADEHSTGSDWKPPEFHGLANSSVITNLSMRGSFLTLGELFKLSPRDMIHAARDTYAINSALTDVKDRLNQSKLTYLAIKSYVLHETSTNPSSMLAPLAKSLSCAEDDDTGDMYELMDTIGEYLEEVDNSAELGVFCLDDADLSTYEVIANMSGNLSHLFSQHSANSPQPEDASTKDLSVWTAPRQFGLQNSKPIVVVKRGADSMWDEYEVIEYADLAEETEEEEEEEEEEDEDDEDYEDSYDEDEEDEEQDLDDYVPSGGMSLSLMKSLGMDTTGMEVETDWKPPTVTGLTADGKVKSHLIDSPDFPGR